MRKKRKRKKIKKEVLQLQGLKRQNKKMKKKQKKGLQSKSNYAIMTRHLSEGLKEPKKLKGEKRLEKIKKSS